MLIQKINSLYYVVFGEKHTSHEQYFLGMREAKVSFKSSEKKQKLFPKCLFKNLEIIHKHSEKLNLAQNDLTMLVMCLCIIYIEAKSGSW